MLNVVDHQSEGTPLVPNRMRLKDIFEPECQEKMILPLFTAAATYYVQTRRGVPGDRIAADVSKIIRDGGVVTQKVAQIVASRPDIITDPFLLRELRELQSREISPGVHQASIATVTLDRDRGIAVKRLNDEDVLGEGRKIALVLALLRPLRNLGQMAVCVDMLDTLLNELDFESELRKNEKLRESLRRSDVVRVPQTLASTDTEVVMEIVDSVLVKDLGDSEVPLALVNAFFRDMTMAAMRTGVCHLDLHSGNVGVSADSRNVVVYDMGSIREVDIRLARKAFGAMFRASELLFFEDWDGLAEHLVRTKLVIEVKKVRNLRLLTDVSLRYARGEATSVDIGMCLREIKGDVNLDASIFQLVQSVSILEGCCKVMNPAFNVAGSFGGVGMFEIMEILES
jgi:predicted unusual protein kinase regulating ubiquinone biosynthesis (AarF/ABC1/UbiB family)